MNDISNIPPVTEQPALPVQPPRRVWGPWATVGLGIAILIVFFIVQVVVMIPLIVSAFSQVDWSAADVLDQVMELLSSNAGLYQSIATIISGIIGTGMIVILIRTYRGAGIAEYLGLNRIGWKAALLSIGIVVAYNFLAGWIQGFVADQTADEQIMIDLYRSAVWPPLFWIAVVIFAPLFEEALFRGFLYEGFRRSRMGVVWTIVITSAGWALLHAAQYQLFNILTIFVLGLIMGVVRWKTKTIWSPFIMHATMNLIAAISLHLAVNA